MRLANYATELPSTAKAKHELVRLKAIGPINGCEIGDEPPKMCIGKAGEMKASLSKKLPILATGMTEAGTQS